MHPSECKHTRNLAAVAGREYGYTACTEASLGAADWVSGLPFVSTRRAFSWPWGVVDALIRSDDVTLYMVTAMHQQKAKLADAQLPA